MPIMAEIGGVYLNFTLWAIALFPGWLVIKQIGYGLGDKKVQREAALVREATRESRREPEGESPST